LKLYGAKSAQEVIMMDMGEERQLAAINLTAALGDASRSDQNTFVNQQRALKLIGQKELQVMTDNSRTVLARLTSELQGGNQLKAAMRTAAENALNRALTKGLKKEDIVAAATLQALRLESAQILQNDTLSSNALNSALNRAATMDRQINSQEWGELMDEAAREFKLDENQVKNLFKAGENEKDRAAREGLALGSREHATALQASNIIAQSARQQTGIEATALQGILTRAAAETRQLSAQEAAQTLQQARMTFTGNQNDQDRDARLFQNLVSNASTERGLDLTEARDTAAHARGVKNSLLEEQRIAIKEAEIDGKIDLTKTALSAEKLALYGQGKTSAKDTALINGAILVWNSPSGLTYDKTSKTYSDKTRRPLTPEMIAALKARKTLGLNDLPDVNFSSTDANSSVETVRPPVVSPYAAMLSQPDFAFGSDAFLLNLANIVVEAASLGMADAPFEAQKNAIKSVENLNNEFIQFFQKASELRDSVFAQKELKSLLPKPASLLEGAGDARSAAEVLYLRIDGAINDINYAINSDVPLSDTGTGSVSSKKQLLAPLMKLRSGYAILAGIESSSSATVNGPISENDLIDDLIDASEKTSAGPQ